MPKHVLDVGPDDWWISGALRLAVKALAALIYNWLTSQKPAWE